MVWCDKHSHVTESRSGLVLMVVLFRKQTGNSSTSLCASYIMIIPLLDRLGYNNNI